ncbi:MAG TPA: hypothetical protein DEG88_08855 [Propionibacteriaceae bacterium]|jgi:hypothetical protein|nr:hypothetical protein [Micropruina sp.]HBX82875.1 hypothetical protein [Propionibacteriaceae bacterium]HBY23376.1 hypothetical protein [Propionibacteriaceae bacterium]
MRDEGPRRTQWGHGAGAPRQSAVTRFDRWLTDGDVGERRTRWLLILGGSLIGAGVLMMVALWNHCESSVRRGWEPDPTQCAATYWPQQGAYVVTAVIGVLLTLLIVRRGRRAPAEPR